jgi:hypothetical protein
LAIEKEFNANIARYEGYSLHEVINIRYFKNVLLASWCVLFKLEAFNSYIKQAREVRKKNNVWWDDQNTRVID